MPSKCLLKWTITGSLSAERYRQPRRTSVRGQRRERAVPASPSISFFVGREDLGARTANRASELACPRASESSRAPRVVVRPVPPPACRARALLHARGTRSEEHTSELQSREKLVCRLLLEKKKNKS